MFPDSKIAAAFSSTTLRLNALSVMLLIHISRILIVKSLKTTPFNLMCDESNDKDDKWKLLSILVRFFYSNTELIVTRHLETVAITDFTDKGIFLSSLKDALETTNHYFELHF